VPACSSRHRGCCWGPLEPSFAECQASRHSTKVPFLPSVSEYTRQSLYHHHLSPWQWLFFPKHQMTLTKHYRNPWLCQVLGSLSSDFCRALGKALHSAKAALGKGPSATVYNWLSLAFAERRALALGKEASLPSVNQLTLGKESFAECHSWTLFTPLFIFTDDRWRSSRWPAWHTGQSGVTPDNPVNFSGVRWRKPEAEEFRVDLPGALDTVRCARPGQPSVSFAPFFLNPNFNFLLVCVEPLTPVEHII
jgi:hypothetical protein